ncbi:unnamed protein product [Dovyalis caffra]|uniref:Uncharacterized protein n=1 Tax=Dovyalis caffra TaxID=77055 RepID=A0AAV1S4L5_9ROSI|nr:unnamed protein product [Dovyalis caffra]
MSDQPNRMRKEKRTYPVAPKAEVKGKLQPNTSNPASPIIINKNNARIRQPTATRKNKFVRKRKDVDPMVPFLAEKMSIHNLQCDEECPKGMIPDRYPDKQTTCEAKLTDEDNL